MASRPKKVVYPSEFLPCSKTLACSFFSAVQHSSFWNHLLWYSYTQMHTKAINWRIKRILLSLLSQTTVGQQILFPIWKKISSFRCTLCNNAQVQCVTPCACKHQSTCTESNTNSTTYWLIHARRLNRLDWSGLNQN